MHNSLCMITCKLLKIMWIDLFLQTIKSAIYSQEPELRDLISHVAKKTPTKWYEVGI